METVKLTLNQSQLATVMIAVNKELENARKITDQEFNNESTRTLMQKNLKNFVDLNNQLGWIAFELLKGKTSFNITKGMA
jgi:hypothetical protein